jgi:hypothetical protein
MRKGLHFLIVRFGKEQGMRQDVRLRYALSALAILSCASFLSGQIPRDSGLVPKAKVPIVTQLYIADPSAHVFEGRIYIYPSHDIPTTVAPDDLGSSFDMKDYRVFSISDWSSPVVDHGEVLNIRDVSWASKQMWAPDAAFKDGRYYLYFPVKDKDGVFRIGVATSPKPEGPFKSEPRPIPGSFSVDPAVFVDDDGEAYMYFGGLWGGQLESWQTGEYRAKASGPRGAEPAMGPRVARLSKDMLEFEGPIKEVAILDGNGRPLEAQDEGRRFFEASWMHKYKGRYYLSYSTGTTLSLVYAVGDSPLGPFTYRGRLLAPVPGWTSHHSILEFQGKWYLFYHDDSISGKPELRSVKFQELRYAASGDILLMRD